MLTINGVRTGEECYPNNERILKSFQHEKMFVFDLRYFMDTDIMNYRRAAIPAL